MASTINDIFRYPMSAFAALTSDIEKLRINRLEDRLIPKIPFPHKHDFIQIVMVTKGKGWHEIDFERHPAKPGSVFVMQSGQVHSWVLSRDTQGYVVEFETSAVQITDHNKDFLEGVIHSLPAHFQLDLKKRGEASQTLERMISEMEKHPIAFEMVFCMHLVIFLMSLYRDLRVSPKAFSRKDEYAAQFIALVERYFGSEHQVEFYAKKLAVSTKTLTMRITRSLGVSPRKVIQERCLLEAKRMLGYSAIPISQIGYKLGFEDPNYFSRFFRLQAGLSPADFRKQVQSLGKTDEKD